MRRIFKTPIFQIINKFPENKSETKKYITFISGTLLTISERMPFVDNQYNGILHMLSKIQQEYKSSFN